MEKRIISELGKLEAIAKALNEQIIVLRNTLPLNEIVQPKQWVILKSQYKFYQFLNNTPESVALIRNKQPEFFKREDFNNHFRLANVDEVFQHENYLLSKEAREEAKEEPNPNFPEFYMLTVNGDKGSFVRHETKENATAEATRLAKKTNNRVHIMGVVGIVEPIVVQMDYQVINK